MGIRKWSCIDHTWCDIGFYFQPPSPKICHCCRWSRIWVQITACCCAIFFNLEVESSIYTERCSTYDRFYLIVRIKRKSVKIADKSSWALEIKFELRIPKLCGCERNKIEFGRIQAYSNNSALIKKIFRNYRDERELLLMESRGNIVERDRYFFCWSESCNFQVCCVAWCKLATELCQIVKSCSAFNRRRQWSHPSSVRSYRCA